MKKLFLTLGLFCFIYFGAFAVQNITSSTFGVEIADFDKDPTKDGDKKTTDKQEVKKDANTVVVGDSRSDCKAKANCSTQKSCCKSQSNCHPKGGSNYKKEDPDKK